MMKKITFLTIAFLGVLAMSCDSKDASNKIKTSNKLIMTELTIVYVS